MFEKLRKRRNKPWSRKKRIIFLLALGVILVYIIISTLISGNEISLPSLNLSVNGLDIMLLCLLGIGLAAVKIHAYIKRRKENEKEK